MHYIFYRLSSQNRGTAISRNFSLYKHPSELDPGDPNRGKMKVTILNREEDSPLMIDSVSTLGFRLNNGYKCYGPIAMFPKTVLSWDVRK